MGGVLTVESIADIVADVDLVDHLISVLLHSCSEDHDLVVLGHRFNKLDAAWPHQEKTFLPILITHKKV